MPLCVAEVSAVPSTLQLLVAPGSIRIVDMLVDHRKIIGISIPRTKVRALSNAGIRLSPFVCLSLYLMSIAEKRCVLDVWLQSQSAALQLLRKKHYFFSFIFYI